MDGENGRVERLERHVSELRHDLDRTQQRGRRQASTRVAP